MSFEILPSIDLRGGKVVDLYQGDFDRETVYDDSAEAWAQRFLDGGARWIHMVDLDGSREGAGANRALVEAVARVAGRGGARVELGGGIRSLETIERALASGVDRVVIGTAAVENPELVGQAVERFGAESIVVGLDVRDGSVATRGWQHKSGLPAADLAARMMERGVVRFICTDVSRDSTLTEPNFDALAELAHGLPASVIASGGVTTADQIRLLAGMGLEGAIVGSALYAGRLTLKEALAAVLAERVEGRAGASTSSARTGSDG